MEPNYLISLFSLQRLLERDTSHNELHLLVLLTEGDETAYRQLYERHADRVFSIAFYYLRSHTAAQDIVQEVFLKLWTHRKELSDIKNFYGWLHLVTRNLVIDCLRKKATEGKILALQNHPDELGPEQIIIGKQTASIIRDAIDNLSPRQKEIYQLAREQGLKHQEIADQLNLSPETVREHMKQALRNMRSYLKKYLGIILLLFSHYLQ